MKFRIKQRYAVVFPFTRPQLINWLDVVYVFGG